MKTITIKVPKEKNGKWSVTLGNGGIRKRKDATVIYRAIERHLQARSNRVKTKIVIKYAKDTSNETVASKNPDYLLYALGCFLEDYISSEMLKRIAKDYLKGSEKP